MRIKAIAGQIQDFVAQNGLLGAFLLSCFWLLWAFVVDPAGEFPLNDDWAYAKPVYYLVEQGRLKLLDWPSMSLIAHVLWGYMVGVLFGFSFTTLRISVICLGAVGLVAFFLLLRHHFDKNRAYKFFCIFVVLSNPLFFSLSYSFMTETPFLAFMLLACYGYFRFTQTGKHGYLLLAVFFSATIVLIRQVGLFVPLAYGLSRTLGERRLRPSCFIPFAMCVLCLIGYNYFLVVTGNTYASLGRFSDLFHLFGEPVILLDRFYVRTGQTILFLGLFLMPVAAIYLAEHWGELSVKERKDRLLLVVAFAPFLVRGVAEIPLGNIIYDLGVGPKTLTDYFHFRLNDHTGGGVALLSAIRAVAAIGGAGLVFCCSDRFVDFLEKSKSKRAGVKAWIECFPVVAIALYYPFLILFDAFFDRYLLPLIPLFALFLLDSEKKRPSSRAKIRAVSFACAFTAMMLFFSVATTRDYLGWNRLRWRAIDYLTGRGVPYPEIDGGFEYSGWYVSEDDNYKWGKACDYKYRITFGELEGYEEIASFSYRRLLPPCRESVYVLRKQENPEGIARRTSGRQCSSPPVPERLTARTAETGP